MKLWKIIFYLTAIFWPLNLYFAVGSGDYLTYIFPALLVVASLFAKYKNYSWYQIPIILIPFIEPKLLLFPFLYFLSEIIFLKKVDILRATLLLTSIIFLIARFDFFYGQTIFVNDYEAQQTVIRNIHLYPNIPMARIFQNKAIIILDKFVGNFFSLIDLNNYFFGFAPRQILSNLNLIKFPFPAIFIFIFSIFRIKKNAATDTLFGILVSSIISLSLLTNFDRNDFVIWIPMTLILLQGFDLVSKYKYSRPVFIVYFLFSTLELIRVLIINKT